jgi:hypothetical protein
MPQATKITDTIITAMTTCIDNLDIKLTTCSQRLNDDTLKRLIDSILGNQEYMLPLKELVFFQL